jgi:hypothetical protein
LEETQDGSVGSSVLLHSARALCPSPPLTHSASGWGCDQFQSSAPVPDLSPKYVPAFVNQDAHKSIKDSSQVSHQLSQVSFECACVYQVFDLKPHPSRASICCLHHRSSFFLLSWLCTAPALMLDMVWSVELSSIERFRGQATTQASMRARAFREKGIRSDASKLQQIGGQRQPM